jgi:hypothetical protein
MQDVSRASAVLLPELTPALSSSPLNSARSTSTPREAARRVGSRISGDSAKGQAKKTAIMTLAEREAQEMATTRSEVDGFNDRLSDLQQRGVVPSQSCRIRIPLALPSSAAADATACRAAPTAAPRRAEVARAFALLDASSDGALSPAQIVEGTRVAEVRALLGPFANTRLEAQFRRLDADAKAITLDDLVRYLATPNESRRSVTLHDPADGDAATPRPSPCNPHPPTERAVRTM